LGHTYAVWTYFNLIYLLRSHRILRYKKLLALGVFLVGRRGASIMTCLIIWNVAIGGLDSKRQMGNYN
jgi:hypothetical protein